MKSMKQSQRGVVNSW